MGMRLEIAADQNPFPAPTILQVGKLSDFFMGLQADRRGGRWAAGLKAGGKAEEEALQRCS